MSRPVGDGRHRERRRWSHLEAGPEGDEDQDRSGTPHIELLRRAARSKRGGQVPGRYYLIRGGSDQLRPNMYVRIPNPR